MANKKSKQEEALKCLEHRAHSYICTYFAFWSSASAAIQQAKSTVDKQFKYLQKNEQACKWGKGLYDLCTRELRFKCLHFDHTFPTDKS